MSKPKLALIPSGYKSGKVYSILPNDATGDFDFTRASGGTRVRKDGLIEEVTNDVPRLDWYNSNCPSLLLESQRTNLLKYSEDYFQSEWSKIRTTISTDQTLAPNGTFTADKIIASTDNNTHRCDQAITLTDGTSYTLSFFVKASEYNCIRASIGQSGLTFGNVASFNLDTETVSTTGTIENAEILDFGNGWFRCIATMDAGTTDRVVIGLGNNDSYSFSGDNSSGLFMWGAMLEQASYSSSYIKTEGEVGGVTRLADECNGSGNADLFNDAEGVLYAEISALANDGTVRYFGLNDGSNNNRAVFLFDGTANRVRAIVSSGGTKYVDFNYTVTDLTEFHKIALKYKVDDFALWIDGVERNTDTSGLAPIGLDNLEFDLNSGGALYGKVKDLRYFDRALTDAELTELTT